MDPAGGSLELVEVRGRRLAVEQQGSGTPVVFIHGTGTYRVVYGDVVEALGDGFRCFRYDRRGFAATGGAPGRWRDHVDDAAALIEALDAGPAVIVGNSGGGVLALELAHRHPEAVRALVLAEPAWRTALTPSADATWALTRTLVTALFGRKEQASTFFYRWATRYVGGGNQYDSYPEDWRTTARGHASSTLREVLQLIVPRPSGRVVRAIGVPTTVIIGGRGRPVFRRTARAVAARVPGAVVVTLPSAAHVLNTDDPEGFATAVADTARRTESSARLH